MICSFDSEDLALQSTSNQPDCRVNSSRTALALELPPPALARAEAARSQPAPSLEAATPILLLNIKPFIAQSLSLSL